MRPGCVFLLAAAQMWGAGLRAGVARKEITPREAIWMSGYGEIWGVKSALHPQPWYRDIRLVTRRPRPRRRA